MVPAVFRDLSFRNFTISRILFVLMRFANGFITVYAIKNLGATNENVATFTAVFMVSQGLGSFLFGPFGDRWAHKLVMSGGCILYAASMVALLTAKSVAFVYIAFSLVGLVEATYMVGVLTLTIDIVATRRKELYIGSLYLITAPFSFFSPILGGKLADLLGYKALFYIAAFVALGALAYTLKFVEDPRTKNGKNQKSGSS